MEISPKSWGRGKILGGKKKKKKKKERKKEIQLLNKAEGVLQKATSKVKEGFKSETCIYFKVFPSSMAVLVSLNDEFQPAPELHQAFIFSQSLSSIC